MTRDDRRQRMLAQQYAQYAECSTGAGNSRMMVRLRLSEIFRDEAYYFCMLPALDSGGQLDAPEYLPAGSSGDVWQRMCRRP